MDLSGLMEVLRKYPPAFQRRLEIVLRQAIEDTADGHGEVTFELSGEGPRRSVRQWGGFFKPTERAPK